MQPLVVSMDNRSRSKPIPTADPVSPTETEVSASPSAHRTRTRALPAERATKRFVSTERTAGSLLEALQSLPPETTMRCDWPGLWSRIPSGSISTDACSAHAHKAETSKLAERAPRTLQE